MRSVLGTSLARRVGSAARASSARKPGEHHHNTGPSHHIDTSPAAARHSLTTCTPFAQLQRKPRDASQSHYAARLPSSLSCQQAPVQHLFMPVLGGNSIIGSSPWPSQTDPSMHRKHTRQAATQSHHSNQHLWRALSTTVDCFSPAPVQYVGASGVPWCPGHSHPVVPYQAAAPSPSAAAPPSSCMPLLSFADLITQRGHPRRPDYHQQHAPASPRYALTSQQRCLHQRQCQCQGSSPSQAIDFTDKEPGAGKAPGCGVLRDAWQGQVKGTWLGAWLGQGSRTPGSDRGQGTRVRGAWLGPVEGRAAGAMEGGAGPGLSSARAAELATASQVRCFGSRSWGGGRSRAKAFASGHALEQLLPSAAQTGTPARAAA
ncbi:hypothetical protein HaLaN_09310, partial [Haematococcus lacustris]